MVGFQGTPLPPLGRSQIYPGLGNVSTKFLGTPRGGSPEIFGENLRFTLARARSQIYPQGASQIFPQGKSQIYPEGESQILPDQGKSQILPLGESQIFPETLKQILLPLKLFYDCIL